MGGGLLPLSLTYFAQVVRMNLSPSVTLAIPVATSLSFSALRLISRTLIAGEYVTLSLEDSDTNPQTVRSEDTLAAIIMPANSTLKRLTSASASL